MVGKPNLTRIVLFADDVRRPEGGQIAVARVHHDHWSSVDHQLRVRRDRAERIPDQFYDKRDADQRDRGPGGERGVPELVADHQPANNRMSRPGNGKGRGHVRRAEHIHRTVRVSILISYYFLQHALYKIIYNPNIKAEGDKRNFFFFWKPNLCRDIIKNNYYY